MVDVLSLVDIQCFGLYVDTPHQKWIVTADTRTGPEKKEDAQGVKPDGHPLDE